ncbi:hypothetical protein G6F56_013183 [Rhizopus delemar]|nr:hypothetical protein G6F56_013183 [Rhizopus delemar]
MFLKFIFFLLTLLIRFVFGKHKSSSVVNNAPIAQTSPLYLKNVQPESVVILRDPEEDMTKVEPLVNNVQLPMDQYPEPDQQPAVNHPEVQAVVKQLDMTLVPKIQPRKVKGWDLVTKDYDFTNDPDCWWSATVCKTPKLYYLPEDIYQCPQKGDWGLNYDDGPYKAWWPETERDKEFDQPRLYNFLAKHGKQKATLFYFG